MTILPPHQRFEGDLRVAALPSAPQAPDCVKTLSKDTMFDIMTPQKTLKGVIVSYIAGVSRDQVVLFPDAIDDYITQDNPVRFIDAFVERMNLRELGFIKTEPAKTGRPGYKPKDLLKLYIYGYKNRITSSRRLEQETHRNMEVIWLLRRLKPDFKTISDFRKENVAAFRARQGQVYKFDF